MEDSDTNLKESNGVLIQGTDDFSAAGLQALGKGQRSEDDSITARLPEQLQLTFKLAYLTGTDNLKKITSKTWLLNVVLFIKKFLHLSLDSKYYLAQFGTIRHGLLDY